MTAMSARVLSIVTGLLTLTIAASGLAVAPVRAEGHKTVEAPAAPLGVAAPTGIQPTEATLATAIVPGLDATSVWPGFATAANAWSSAATAAD